MLSQKATHPVEPQNIEDNQGDEDAHDNTSLMSVAGDKLGSWHAPTMAKELKPDLPAACVEGVASSAEAAEIAARAAVPVSVMEPET